MRTAKENEHTSNEERKQPSSFALCFHHSLVGQGSGSQHSLMLSEITVSLPHLFHLIFLTELITLSPNKCFTLPSNGRKEVENEGQKHRPSQED